MKTYKQLEKEFNEKVKKLQDSCPHKRKKWMEKWWAIGHSSGYQVNVCLRCNKIVKEKPTEEERKKEFEEHIKILK